MSLSRSEIVARAREAVKGEALAIQSLTEQFDESFIEVLSLLLNCQGHVLVSGIGTSQAIAERFAHLLSCSGTPALFINASNGLHGGSGAITPADVVFLISKGGHSFEINRFAEIAHNRGAKLVAQTENPESPLARMCDVVFVIRTEGDVDPYGMIATGSSLVNGAAGDALCVLLLEMRGYTREAFGHTHPGGAVGKRLEESQDTVSD